MFTHTHTHTHTPSLEHLVFSRSGSTAKHVPALLRKALGEERGRAGRCAVADRYEGTTLARDQGTQDQGTRRLHETKVVLYT